MNRAYSTLDIKSVDEEARLIVGTASTPTPDRLGDTLQPQGAKFVLPLPLLWQHKSDLPIGHVTQAKVTPKGIEIVAQIAKGILPEIDRAWTLIKAGLVRGLSVGFKGLDAEQIPNTWGTNFKSWEWVELSAVTIPANSEASILAIKQFDVGLPSAAPGHKTKPVVAILPGATGPSTQKAQEKPMPKTIAEQLSAFEGTRQVKLARMDAIMEEAATTGETLNGEQETEHDTLAAEVKALDTHLKRLHEREAYLAATAKPVEVQPVMKAVDDTRGGIVVVKPQAKLAPGIALARYAKVKAVSRLENEPMQMIAAKMYGTESDVYGFITKANEVLAGSTVTGNWAATLVGAETGMVADFAEFLRPATILGKFGNNGIPALRSVEFRVPLISQLTGGDAYWVGEGKPKPLTSFTFARTTLEPTKIANIAVLTEESIRSSNPKSDGIVATGLREAIAAGQDTAFIDPANGGTPNVKPASVTNGAETIASTGDDADAIRVDVRAVFQKFVDADNPPESGVWVMSTTNALALSLIMNPLGQKEFPGVGMTGGTFEGIPVIASRYAGPIVALINASDIYEADEGQVAVDMSREASLEMKNASLTQDAGTGVGAAMVSMFQTNSVAIRAERTINWIRRRDSAVAYLTGVTWGGAVPAS
jgi:HK97 family phage prohead protease